MGGIVIAFFVDLVQPIGRRALRNEHLKLGYDQVESKADEVVNNPHVRAALCLALHERPKDEILTEKTFIRVVTDTLSTDELLQSRNISRDPKLFGMIGYLIQKIGAENYCRQ